MARSLPSGENGNTDKDTGDEAPAVSTASVLGMTVGELNDETRTKFGIAAEVSGVVITDVAEDSAAAERGIQAGEVITEIAQESVADAQGCHGPDRCAEGAGTQECAADAGVEDRRIAVCDDPDGLSAEARADGVR